MVKLRRTLSDDDKPNVGWGSGDDDQDAGPDPDEDEGDGMLGGASVGDLGAGAIPPVGLPGGEEEEEDDVENAPSSGMAASSSGMDGWGDDANQDPSQDSGFDDADQPDL